ncbi:glutathione S-transferase family protein [Loktanella sp. DJP18]|uniref:glutathione S-transferase family protein n=1 Tax=Loktanella sp. DJP18 TaxID=3409788 RepID=UPI003BB7F3D8
MLTLFHAPRSRSTRIIQLLHELDALDQVDVRIVDLPRQDGSGARDPANPHPEGKVPLLVHDGVEIWESNAIILYLTDLFGTRPFAPQPGDPDRGRYLSWLAWYGNVIEPVLVTEVAGLSHPILTATFRGRAELEARLIAALTDAPFLMGDHYSAADLLQVSPWTWFSDAAPKAQVVQDWIARCSARPSGAAASAFDEAATATPHRMASAV